jgi:hypothetical protein
MGNPPENGDPDVIGMGVNRPKPLNIVMESFNSNFVAGTNDKKPKVIKNSFLHISGAPTPVN